MVKIEGNEEIHWVSEAVGHHIWTCRTARLACAELCILY